MYGFAAEPQPGPARSPRLGLEVHVVEGVVMAGGGILAGSAFGFVLARLAGKYFVDMKMPGLWPVSLSAFVLMAVAVIASMLPAVRAARVDVMEALRYE